MQNETKANTGTGTLPRPTERRTAHTGIRYGKRAKPTLDEIRSLGSLEAEVLNVLWDLGHSASGMEVMEFSLYHRRSQGKEPSSFASISTTLRRLSDKGIVLTEKNGARTPMYVPTVNREDMAARVLNNVSVKLLGRPLHDLLPKLKGNAKQTKLNTKNAAVQQRLIKALTEDALLEVQ